MMKNFIATLFAIAVLSILGVAQGQATPVKYVFTVQSHVSGTLGNRSFTDATLVVTTHADTNNISQNGAELRYPTNLPGSFTLSGFGSGSWSGSFTNSLSVFAFSSTVGFSLAGNGGGTYELIALTDSALTNYDLGFPFTASYTDSGYVNSNFSFGVGTSLGTLTIDSGNFGDAGTFQAVAAVPEPSAFALFGIGLLGIGVLRYRGRKRKARTGSGSLTPV